MLVSDLIFETTDDDRAIVNVSKPLHTYITTHHSDVTKSTVLGSVGDILDTDVGLLSPIRIKLWPRRSMSRAVGLIHGNTPVGFWDPSTKSIVLNIDFLDSIKLKTTITHELRHALDDIKSDYRASYSTRYNTPKKSQHRDHPQWGYLAQPSEINARFSEILHVLTLSVIRAKRNAPADVKSQVMQDFNSLLKNKRIAELFPERERSREYKRLIKRVLDFIHAEIDEP